MLPRCWQLLMWMWETCADSAWRPLMTSSIVKLPGLADSRIVPLAVVLMPTSAKVRPPGDGDGLWVAAGGLGEGDAAAVLPPEAPLAEMVAATATSATILFTPAVSPQWCSWRYQSRLLDGHRSRASIDRQWAGFPRPTVAPTPVDRSRVPPAGTAGAP